MVASAFPELARRLGTVAKNCFSVLLLPCVSTAPTILFFNETTTRKRTSELRFIHLPSGHLSVLMASLFEMCIDISIALSRHNRDHFALAALSRSLEREVNACCNYGARSWSILITPILPVSFHIAHAQPRPRNTTHYDAHALVPITERIKPTFPRLAHSHALFSISGLFIPESKFQIQHIRQTRSVPRKHSFRHTLDAHTHC